MIVVDVGDSETVFEDATRFSTDEHNNLQIWTGPDGDRLLAVFALGVWQTVGVAGGED